MGCASFDPAQVTAQRMTTRHDFAFDILETEV